MSFVFLVVVILLSLHATFSIPIPQNALVGTVSQTPSISQNALVETLLQIPSSIIVQPRPMGNTLPFAILGVSVPKPAPSTIGIVRKPVSSLTVQHLVSSVTAPQPAINEVTVQLDYIEPNIVSNLVEKSSIIQYNNKLVEEFDELIVSNDAKNFKWQVLSEVVKNIMKDKETLDYMVKKHSDEFGFAYEQHYIQKKKAFSLFRSVHSSFCMSILMGKYH